MYSPLVKCRIIKLLGLNGFFCRKAIRRLPIFNPYGVDLETK